MRCSAGKVHHHAYKSFVSLTLQIAIYKEASIKTITITTSSFLTPEFQELCKVAATINVSSIVMVDYSFHRAKSFGCQEHVGF